MKPLTVSQSGVVFGTAENLLVGAGAGSGKTTTVVRTICYRLGAAVPDADGTIREVDAPLQLSDIAAITFTNQAAADLKRKLRQALRASGLRHLAADVDAARIGTIHSFCGDLLRDFALRAGLPPSARVLDEGESRTLTRECAERVLLHAASTQPLEWLKPLTSGRRLHDVIEAIAKLADDADRLAGFVAHAAALRLHEARLLELAQQTANDKLAQLDELGAYDFDRIIVATRNLLRDNADVRRAVQRQIQLLIVDEFQDVDPAQRDIALLLSGLDTHESPATRLLLVGDPKQSIFRFRRADVTLWNGMAERFASRPSDGRVVSLTENFRSRHGILAFVDNVIGAEIARPIAPDGVRKPFEVDYAPLAACGDNAVGDECVELLYVPARDDGKCHSADDVRAFEARAIARRVNEMVASGRRYGDIAMLLSGWGAASIYESALRDAGIPVYLLRSDGFWEAREIVDCLLALRAIRDGGDTVNDVPALVGFLKSPFVGVRDDTLLALSLNPQGWHAALRDEPRERALLSHAVAMLTRFHELRDRIPLGQLVQQLVTESGFLAALALDPERGPQAVGNIRKLLRLANEARELSLGEWLHDVELARERGDEVAQERLYRERADVVTITSVHSAKGLEWPVVIWADLVREQRMQSDALLVGRDEFRLKDVQALGDDGKAVDAAYDALRDAQAMEQAAETFRLWYVAATRPQELLIVSGVPLGKVTGSTPSVARLLRTHFAEHIAPETTRLTYAHADGTPYSLVVRAIPVEEGALLDDIVAMTESPILTEPPAARPAPMGRTRLSASQLMQFAKSREAWWNRYAFGFEPDRVAQTIVAGASSTTVIGTIVHEVLERYQYEPSDIDELIDQAIARNEDDDTAPLENRYREQIRALIDSAITHRRWQELASVDSARRELTFTRVFSDGNVIDGAFDLSAVVSGVSQILDVKTGGRGDIAVVAEQYALQAATYVEAAEAITGRPAAFALLRIVDGEVIPVDADRDAVRSTIKALRGSQAPRH